MKANVGTRVKSLCESKDITAAELERTLELANGTVARWLKGSIPNGVALEKVAKYFRVSSDYLLGLSIYKTREEEWDAKYNSAKLSKDTKTIETIAAHLDDVELDDEDAEMLELYIKSLVKKKKK